MFCVLYPPSICQIGSAQITISWLLLRGYLRVLQVRRGSYLTVAVIRCSEIVDTIRATRQDKELENEATEGKHLISSSLLLLERRDWKEGF